MTWVPRQLARLPDRSPQPDASRLGDPGPGEQVRGGGDAVAGGASQGSPAELARARQSAGRGAVAAQPAVLAEGVSKRFGSLTALDGVTVEVASGSVLALLGPNGAGKTTLVRILTTLIAPSDGQAFVGGFDVVREAAAVRRIIGLAGQSAAVDDILSGVENLELVGRLYHLPRGEARRRAEELIERFSLTGARDRRAGTYSGGMRRRLDLAASLVARPQVLFLDEPTTGLDPGARLDLWQLIEDLVADGTTVLLTTQYLEEADRLADRIVVVDEGRVIAQGTATELKAQAGRSVLHVTVDDRSRTDDAATALGALGEAPRADAESGELFLPIGDGANALTEAVRALDAAGIATSNLAVQQPTLDDVFLALTDHPLRTGAATGSEPQR
jgi:ABC-2 type transport system ATP-binding protein